MKSETANELTEAEAKENLYECAGRARGLLYALAAVANIDFRDIPRFCEPTPEEREGMLALAVTTGKDLERAIEAVAPRF